MVIIKGKQINIGKPNCEDLLSLLGCIKSLQIYAIKEMKYRQRCLEGSNDQDD